MVAVLRRYRDRALRMVGARDELSDVFRSANERKIQELHREVIRSVQEVHDELIRTEVDGKAIGDALANYIN